MYRSIEQILVCVCVYGMHGLTPLRVFQFVYVLCESRNVRGRAIVRPVEAAHHRGLFLSPLPSLSPFLPSSGLPSLPSLLRSLSLSLRWFN